MFLALWQNSFSFGRLGTASPKFPSRFDLYQRAGSRQTHRNPTERRTSSSSGKLGSSTRGSHAAGRAVPTSLPQLHRSSLSCMSTPTTPSANEPAQTLAKADPVSKHVGDPSAEKVAIQTLK